MKLKITRAKLLNGINAVAGINKGVQMQVLRNMRLDAVAGYLSLTTTNLDLQVVFRTKAEVEDTGDILMDSAFLARFVTAMPEGVVTIEAEKDKMAHITGGEVNYHLATDDPANFPAMATADTDDKDKTLFIPCVTLAEMIRKVRFAASTRAPRRHRHQRPQPRDGGVRHERRRGLRGDDPIGDGRDPLAPPGQE